MVLRAPTRLSIKTCRARAERNDRVRLLMLLGLAPRRGAPLTSNPFLLLSPFQRCTAAEDAKLKCRRSRSVREQRRMRVQVTEPANRSTLIWISDECAPAAVSRTLLCGMSCAVLRSAATLFRATAELEISIRIATGVQTMRSRLPGVAALARAPSAL